MIKLCITLLLPGLIDSAETVSTLDNFLTFRDTNCDLHIIHDAVDSDIFHTKGHQIQPRVIIHSESPYKPGTIDVFQTRPGPCHVSLFLINFYRFPQICCQEENHDLPRLFEIAQNWQLHFIEDNLKRPIPTKNMYTVILANGEKSSQVYNNKQIFSQNIYNFAVLYISGNRIVNICIKTFDISQNVKCFEKVLPTSKLFTELLHLAPKFWTVSYDQKKLPNLKLINAPISLNPFNQSGDPFTVEHLARSVFNRANVTAVSLFTCIELHTACGWVRLRKISLGDGYAKSAPVMWAGYQFLSCFKETFISFKFYVFPFQKEVWVTLFVSIVTVVTSIYLYIKLFTGERKISFCPWLFILSTLFEEPPAISDKKLEAHFIFRFVLGSWCLVSVILTNCYNGLMITDLNAPLGSVQPKSFRDLICWQNGQLGGHQNRKELEEYVDPSLLTWYSLAVTAHTNQYSLDENYTNFRNPYVSKDCFKLLSPAQEHLSYRVPYFQFVSFLLTEYSKSRESSHSFKNNDVISPATELLYLNLLHPRQGQFPGGLDYSKNQYLPDDVNRKIETEIVDCSQKNVFVTSDEDFHVQYKFLKENYFSKEFYTGKDVLDSKLVALVFFKEGYSKVPRYSEGLVETGIYARIEEEIETRQVLDRIRGKKRVIEDETKPFGLNGAIFTLFILCGCVILGAATSFVCGAKVPNWVSQTRLQLETRLNFVPPIIL
ncbi:hypothetical protein Fcan01_16318 [Folsomia candida]|uniref:Uncharacterized protein n=1 Tax=Folsomia candida TaxID=158441 RepID=A0A226DX18_FOLCA|nr:hypothetical protein Fcan01_16318 [Folsomia candida]